MDKRDNMDRKLFSPGVVTVAFRPIFDNNSSLPFLAIPGCSTKSDVQPGMYDIAAGMLAEMYPKFKLPIAAWMKLKDRHSKHSEFIQAVLSVETK